MPTLCEQLADGTRAAWHRRRVPVGHAAIVTARTLTSVDGSAATSSPLDTEDLRVRGSRRRSTTSWPARSPASTRSATTWRPLVDAVATCVSGGKRLRPAFCYWGWRGAGGADERRDRVGRDVARAPPGVRADPRRRHGRLRHPARACPPSTAGSPRCTAATAGSATPEPFGVGAARSSLGDLCLSWADEMLAGCGLPPSVAGRGQAGLRPDAHRADGGPVPRPARAGAAGATASVERARRVIRYKSAKYTVEQPAAPRRRRWPARRPTLLAAYSAYGLPLGEAFQLRDDVLGVFGDPARHRQAGRRRPARGQADRAGRRRRSSAADPGAGGAAAPPPRRPAPGRRRASSELREVIVDDRCAGRGRGA